jgi:hypothetical protein
MVISCAVEIDEPPSERLTKVEARMDKFDKRLNAIAKLVQQGMRLIVDGKADTDRRVNALIDSHLHLEEKVRGLTDRVADLAEAQKTTEQTLQAFIESLRQGRNGH